MVTNRGTAHGGNVWGFKCYNAALPGIGCCSRLGIKRTKDSCIRQPYTSDATLLEGTEHTDPSPPTPETTMGRPVMSDG